jgi:RNA-binding protein 39
MALEQMEGFELAGRQVIIIYLLCHLWFLTSTQLRVNTVHEKGSGVRYAGTETLDDTGGQLACDDSPLTSLNYHTGANLNAASRQALMQKLSRVDTPGVPQPIPCVKNVPLGSPLLTNRQGEACDIVNLADQMCLVDEHV